MLKNKKVFITGGTGSIGEAICRKCASYGATVLFSFHANEGKADALEKELPNSRKVCINMLDCSDISRKTAEVFAAEGPVDALINNAGVSQVMPFSLIEEADYDLMMEVNVKGAFFMTKAFVRGMIKAGKGAIVNIGSIAGHRMYDVPVHYAVAKAALSGFTYALAAELKRYHIRVNSVVPGLIEGGISRGIPDDLRKDFIAHCACGRAGTPAEVAELAAFLVSDRSSYINGQNILIDGGI